MASHRIPRELLIIVTIALVLRLCILFFLLSAGNVDLFLQGDSHGYLAIAHNVIAGNGFSMGTTSPYLPDSIRMPAYPLLLAGSLTTTGTLVPLLLFQILVAGALIILAYYLGLLLVGQKVARVVALLIAFEPFSLFITLNVLTDLLFATIFLGGAYAAYRYLIEPNTKTLIVASAVFGVATLVRPIGEFLPLILLILIAPLFPQKLFWKRAACAILPFLLIISPWLVRNYVEFHSFALSSGGFQNSYSDLGGSIVAVRDHISFADAKNRLEADFAARHHVGTEDLAQNLDLSPELFKEGVTLALSNPVPSAITGITITVAFFTHDLWVYALQKWGIVHQYAKGFSPSLTFVSQGPLAALTGVLASGPTILIALLGRVFWVVIDALAILGFIRFIREKGKQRSVAFLTLGFIAYFYLLSLSTGLGINGRFRYPVFSFLFLFATVGALTLTKYLPVHTKNGPASQVAKQVH